MKVLILFPAYDMWNSDHGSIDLGQQSTLAHVMASCLMAVAFTWTKVKVMPKVKPTGHIEFNRCLLFVLWQLDHFGVGYGKFHIWPWKFKIKVMAEVKPDGQIWGLEFNQLLFRGNRTIFGWDIAKFIFDLENSRSRSQWKSTKI